MNTIKSIAVSAVRISAGAIFCLNFLAACSALPAPPVHPVVYDFGPGASRVAAQGAALAPQRAPLVLADVESPGLPEGSTALNYRLGYDDAQQLRAYQRARWSQPPGQLVQQSVAAELSAERAVLGYRAAREAAREGNGGLLVLRLELEEFSQVFSSASQSEGVLRLRATLAEPTPQGERLRAQRVFEARQRAPSADAAGGSAALAQAARPVARGVRAGGDQAAAGAGGRGCLGESDSALSLVQGADHGSPFFRRRSGAPSSDSANRHPTTASAARCFYSDPIESGIGFRCFGERPDP